MHFLNLWGFFIKQKKTNGVIVSLTPIAFNIYMSGLDIKAKTSVIFLSKTQILLDLLLVEDIHKWIYEKKITLWFNFIQILNPIITF